MYYSLEIDKVIYFYELFLFTLVSMFEIFSKSWKPNINYEFGTLILTLILWSTKIRFHIDLLDKKKIFCNLVKKKKIDSWSHKQILKDRLTCGTCSYLGCNMFQQRPLIPRTPLPCDSERGIKF